MPAPEHSTPLTIPIPDITPPVLTFTLQKGYNSVYLRCQTPKLIADGDTSPGWELLELRFWDGQLYLSRSPGICADPSIAFDSDGRIKEID